MSTSELEEFRQKKLENFEVNCRAIGGTPYLIHAEETTRYCDLPGFEVSLRMPQDSFYGSLRVDRTPKKKGAPFLGVLFVQRSTEVL